MALTQDQIAAQMIAQLRLLDPSVSAEIGTPERKIIDTVAQQLAQSQVDINVLGGGHDLTAMFGTDLDTYLGMFGFGRQSGAVAVGFVTFSRPTASSYDIIVPRGTQVQGPVAGTLTAVTFQTSTAVTLVAGATEVIAPIEALLPGSPGNVAANVITQFGNLGGPPLGITAVNNDVPTTGGSDGESDAELKVRFRNTVFRNVAGTEDQFLALALSTQFSTKALVLGPISRYHEYIQVPFVDDSEVDSPLSVIEADATTGSPVLTAVSVTFLGQPLIGSGITGTGLGIDVTIIDIEDAGTTYTLSEPFTGSTASGLPFNVTTGAPALGIGNGLPDQWTTSPSNNPYAKYIYLSVPNFVSNGASGADTVFYRQDSDFTLNAPPLNAGDTYREVAAGEFPAIGNTPYRPNVTFFNVYEGGDPNVTLPTPGAVLLLEYSYMSAESRNDMVRNVLNCVDVYVDGRNPTTADAVLPPLPGGVNLFTDLPTDKFYRQNFRRVGHPTSVPTLNHIFTGLFWQPVTALPSQIVAGGNTYFEGTHYWAVEDITSLRGTVRSRNGIEWDPTAIGDGGGDPITGTGLDSLTVAGYTYDKNIVDLQAAMEASKQVTTDVLAHAATLRYLKLDVTVVYASGTSPAVTNTVIAQTLQTFLDGRYFGTTIQLTDLLLAIRGVRGVQNVRWSNDIAVENTLNRVTYCDVDGEPLGATLIGTATFASNILTGVAVVDGIPAIGQVISGQGSDVFPPETFITAISGTTYSLSAAFTGSSDIYTFALTDAFNEDFFLLDSELPTLPTGQLGSDTLPGLVIRARAQNTFERF